MRIHRATAYKISLPFTADFSHSRRKGNEAQNVVVEVVTPDGEIKGYGEAAPRTYVTGESQESVVKCFKHFLHKDTFPWKLTDVSQIWEFIDSLPYDKEVNSAVCALEMSLLDLLAKYENKSILEYFPKDYYTDKIHYGAGIPFADSHRIIDICRFIKKLKITKVKIKMGRSFAANKEPIISMSEAFFNCT